MSVSYPRNDAFRRATRFGLAAGLLGLVACVAGAVLDARLFFPAYLFAYVFWAGMSIGMLALTLLHHLVRGTWGFPIQRLVEAGARTLPLMAALFIPLVFGLRILYPWSNPEVVAADAVLQHKSPYLNVPFFLLRTALYFAVWIFFAYRISSLSQRLDRERNGGILGALRSLGAGGTIVIALTVTFAAFDWVMSLEPHWFSSIYGLMVGMGMVLGAFALVVVLVVTLARDGKLGDAVSARTLNDLGALLLAFVMLWAYLAFSQFMLIWSGNLAEEIPWYVRRLAGGWKFVAAGVLLLHFALPFMLLIFRDVKRNGPRLAAVAAFLVVTRLLDTFWLVIPAFDGVGLNAILLYIGAVLGIGGYWVAFFAWNLGRQPLLPADYPRPAHDRGLVPAGDRHIEDTTVRP